MKILGRPLFCLNQLCCTMGAGANHLAMAKGKETHDRDREKVVNSR